MSLYKATETFFTDKSESPIFKGAILPGDDPVVKAQPQFFEPIEAAAEHDSRAVWENATAEPGEVRKTTRRKRQPESAE